MPDHPSSLMQPDYDTFVRLIDWCDVLFLLVDTREARWFPTVVASARDKLVVNAAVGFESYVVMRHGLREQGSGRLGCYFCSDIVSPQNVNSPTPLCCVCLPWRGVLCMCAFVVGGLSGTR